MCMPTAYYMRECIHTRPATSQLQKVMANADSGDHHTESELPDVSENPTLTCAAISKVRYDSSSDLAFATLVSQVSRLMK